MSLLFPIWANRFVTKQVQSVEKSVKKKDLNVANVSTNYSGFLREANVNNCVRPAHPACPNFGLIVMDVFMDGAMDADGFSVVALIASAVLL